MFIIQECKGVFSVVISEEIHVVCIMSHWVKNNYPRVIT